MKQKVYVLVFMTLTLFSCNRIKEKGKGVVSKVERKIINSSKELVDKTFPHFDYNEEDTRYNIKRFEEYLEIKLSSDIRDIYCFGDFLGSDYKVLFSFTCDSLTIQNIIEEKGLRLTMQNDDHGLLFMDEFDWWDKEKIRQLKAYKKGKEHEFWQYLWYDTDTKKAYYEEYSL